MRPVRFLVLGLPLVASCAAAPPPSCGPVLPERVAWVTDHGWHTEIAVPASQVQGPLAVFRAMLPGAPMLSFGFGKRDFFTRSATGSSDLAAGVVPGEGTVRVLALPIEPGQGHGRAAVQIALTPAEWAGLQAFLWKSLAQRDGELVPITPDAGVSGTFFASAPGYSLAYTCNTWTVDGLQNAGFQVSQAVVRSAGAMAQAAAVRGACASVP